MKHTLSKKNELYPTLVSLFGHLGKRKRFLLATGASTLVFLLTTFFTLDESPYFLGILLAVAYFATFFSVLEGITRHEWLMLFIAPVYFTVLAYLFYFFLPQRWLTRLPFVVVYAICMYAILLSQNIFNVGVTKSLQLFRAASSVNFLFLTLSSYLAYSVIFSFRLDFALNFLLVFIATIPLSLQFLWAVSPQDTLARSTRRYAIIISLIGAEAAMMLSFLPLNPALFALFLTACFYSLCGLFQAHLQDRLFAERVREYAFVLVFVSVILLLAMG